MKIQALGMIFFILLGLMLVGCESTSLGVSDTGSQQADQQSAAVSDNVSAQQTAPEPSGTSEEIASTENSTSSTATQNASDAPSTPDTSADQKYDKVVTVEEGDLVSLVAKAKDPDGNDITLKFSSPLNAEGKWQTKEGDKGTYSAAIEANDGKATTTKNVQIIVKEKNKPPMIKFIAPVTLKAGDTIRFEPEVSDPNGDAVTVTYSDWINESQYITSDRDIGEHSVTITASDGKLVDKKFVKVTVIPKNNPPHIEDMQQVVVSEGDTIKLQPKITDPDGDPIHVTYSGWMKGDTYTTNYDDAGVHTVTITASDSKAVDVKQISITVKDRNRAPELDIEVG